VLKTAANSAGYVAAMTDRIAVGRQAVRKVFTPQTLPPCDNLSVTGGQGGRVLAACATAGPAFAATVSLLNVISNVPAVMLRPAASKRFAGPLFVLVSAPATNYLK
jgi:hypothetical protein